MLSTLEAATQGDSARAGMAAVMPAIVREGGLSVALLAIALTALRLIGLAFKERPRALSTSACVKVL